MGTRNLKVIQIIVLEAAPGVHFKKPMHTVSEVGRVVKPPTLGLCASRILLRAKAGFSKMDVCISDDLQKDLL